MNAVVIVIDAFDHGLNGYADPAPISPMLMVPRAAPALVANYHVSSHRHIDRRLHTKTSARDEDRARHDWNKQFAAFESDDYEEYQYLLLGDAPLHDPAVGMHPVLANRIQWVGRCRFQTRIHESVHCSQPDSSDTWLL
jgi:hypothetical protein